MPSPGLRAPPRGRPRRRAKCRMVAPSRSCRLAPHERVEVHAQSVEPVAAVLGRRQGGMGDAELFRVLVRAPEGVHRARSSQVLRDSRRLALEDPHTERRTTPTTMPSGINNRTSGPIASAADGALGSSTACRICVRTTAIGLARYACCILVRQSSIRRAPARRRRGSGRRRPRSADVAVAEERGPTASSRPRRHMARDAHQERHLEPDSRGVTPEIIANTQHRDQVQAQVERATSA